MGVPLDVLHDYRQNTKTETDVIVLAIKLVRGGHDALDLLYCHYVVVDHLLELLLYETQLLLVLLLLVLNQQKVKGHYLVEELHQLEKVRNIR